MNLAQEIAWWIIIALASCVTTIAVINQKSFMDEDEYNGRND